MKLVVALLSLSWMVMVSVVAADTLSGSGILDPGKPFRIDSVRLRYTFFDQSGRGYQSLAGAGARGPGSEQLSVSEPQVEVIAHQGSRITHRIWAPLDVVSAASPDAVDAISRASRYQEAGGIDVASTFKADRDNDVGTRFAIHLEENYRSWTMGLAWTRHMAEDNAVLQASVNQTFDWFDAYNLGGSNRGREARSTTNANVAFTQILSPTTVANLNYGFTLQTGELSNTWNTVPLVDGTHGTEVLPHLRTRHALVGRLVQGLPWNGSFKVSYRFYIDSWGAIGNTLELFLYQRITRWLYARATYRAHFQRGVDFYTQLALLGNAFRTADSDLADFSGQTAGGKLALELPLRRIRVLNVDLAYERYWRTNDLRVNVYSASVGTTF
ncbi:MAG: DUF3570 domain-containing protein [Polyangia bacterium]